ncbi:hypothetical protein DFH29DRAFT_917625 [Suillus ampliporus]|nr:hypothetical protein DFH29DRAFT_917625 [Suillus ampliporus]
MMERVAIFNGYTQYNFSLAWAPDGTRLLSAGDGEDPPYGNGTHPLGSRSVIPRRATLNTSTPLTFNPRVHSSLLNPCFRQRRSWHYLHLLQAGVRTQIVSRRSTTRHLPQGSCITPLVCLVFQQIMASKRQRNSTALYLFIFLLLPGIELYCRP